MALIRCGSNRAGVTLIGSYTSDTTVDISAYSGVTVNDFIVECPTAADATVTLNTSSYAAAVSKGTYTPASLSISGNTLTVTLPTILEESASGTGLGRVTETTTIPINLYLK